VSRSRLHSRGASQKLRNVSENRSLLVAGDHPYQRGTATTANLYATPTVRSDSATPGSLHARNAI
jgi:hypothetical protein